MSLIQYSTEKLNTNTKAGRRRQTSGVATGRRGRGEGEREREIE